ncbi:hypothetical protein M405DRAFT_858651 [Rhizopogon salebrosus TDB-379]|nr:hypothetical protein M405DRAFT_858651 [Rhizopogon salebrosus TDB-379]
MALGARVLVLVERFPTEWFRVLPVKLLPLTIIGSTWMYDDVLVSTRRCVRRLVGTPVPVATEASVAVRRHALIQEVMFVAAHPR